MIRSELQSLLKRVYLNGINDYVTIRFTNNDSAVSASFTTSGSVMYGEVVGTMTGLPTSTIVVNNLNEVINTLNSFSNQIITQYGENYLIIYDIESEIPPLLNLELVSLSLPNTIKTPEEIQIERLPEEGGFLPLLPAAEGEVGEPYPLNFSDIYFEVTGSNNFISSFLTASLWITSSTISFDIGEDLFGNRAEYLTINSASFNSNNYITNDEIRFNLHQHFRTGSLSVAKVNSLSGSKYSFDEFSKVLDSNKTSTYAKFSIEEYGRFIKCYFEEEPLNASYYLVRIV
jgi:hypothetical protein